MKADITRNTFDPGKQFTRVLMQQGRVQLDSDWNEQVAILLHYMQTLARDIIGPHGGPNGDPNGDPNDRLGFEIGLDDNGEPTIGPGRYYVDGILCENPAGANEDGQTVFMPYRAQPYYPLTEEDELPESPFLVYLDVWEHHVTAIEDAGIREVALGGPDTATRARAVWQVKVDPGENGSGYEDGSSGLQLDCFSVENNWDQWVKRWQPTNRGMLRAKGRENLDEDADPCIVSPEARYRGAENQLYRVEIHRPGAAAQPTEGPDTVPGPEAVGFAGETDTNVGAATFKWSRDNGSVTFPVRDLDGSVVTLENLGRDEHLGLKVGDLVEIVDEDYVLLGQAQPLLRVEEIDAANTRVTLSGEPASGVGRDPEKHPLLRRWDHGSDGSQNGAVGYDTLPLREDTWLTLEDGIQIYFQPAPDQAPNYYRTGDYWLIPARTATGDVEWPGGVGQPEARPPHGIDHHYAPLAIVQDGSVEGGDCRCGFVQLGVCPSDNRKANNART